MVTEKYLSYAVSIELCMQATTNIFMSKGNVLSIIFFSKKITNRDDTPNLQIQKFFS
jgi:hypothetical protein